jgi:hypothetical protein
VAESRRKYRWVTSWDDQLAAEIALPVMAGVAARWERLKPWVVSCRVERHGGNLVVIAVVRAKDQWRVQEYQARLIRAVSATIRGGKVFGAPEVSRLPPHRHRGLAFRRMQGGSCQKCQQHN